MDIRNKLKGKKTYLGAICGAILTIVYSLDMWANDNPATLDVTEVGWMSIQMYTMLAGLIVSWTGVALRIGMKSNDK